MNKIKILAKDVYCLFDFTQHTGRPLSDSGKYTLRKRRKLFKGENGKKTNYTFWPNKDFISLYKEEKIVVMRINDTLCNY